MQSKRREHEQAIAFRQQGLSYSEIRHRVPVAKSSLSIWLRQVGLPEWQHEKANISAAQDFWVRSLGIDRERLRTYLKRHNPSPKRHNVGASYYGTMRIRYSQEYRSFSPHCRLGSRID